MTNFAALVMTADATDLADATVALDKLTASAGKTEAAVKSDMAGVSAAFYGVAAPIEGAIPPVERFGASFDKLRAMVDPVYVASKRYEYAVLEMDAALESADITLQQHARLLDLAGTKYLGLDRSVVRASDRMTPAMNRASGSVANMTAQFNDIAVMMAAGQNPLQLAMQQGSQITQAFGPGGAAGAVGLLKGAFLSMLNPLNLLVIGGIAVGAAMFQWLTGAGEKARTLDDIFTALEGDLKAIKAADEAMSSAGAADLAEKYGLIDDTLVSILRHQKELAEIDAFASIRESASALRDTLSAGIFTSETGGMAALLDVTERMGQSARGVLNPAVAKMGELLAQIENADSLGQAATAMAELSQLIHATNPDMTGLNAEQRALVASIDAGALKARELAVAMQDGSANAGTLASAVANVAISTEVAASAAASATGLYTQLGQVGWWAADASRDLAYNTAAAADYAAAVAANGGGIYGVLATAADAAWDLASALSSAMASLGAVGSGMVDAVGLGWIPDALGDIASAAINSFTSAGDAVQTFASHVGTRGSGGGGGGGGGGGSGAAGAVDDLTAAQLAAADASAALASAVGGPLTSAMDGLISWTVGGFEGGWQAIGDEFKTMWEDLISYALKNQIQGMIGMNADGTMLAGSAGAGFTDALSSSLSGGFGSLFNISANIAAAGGGLAATLGALVGPLGLVFGLFSAFKTTTTQLDAGLKVSIDGMQALATEFETVRKTSFFGLISNTSTNTNAVSDQSQAQIDAIYGDITTNVTDAAAALGIASDAFAEFSYDFTLSTKGMTDAEASQAIAAEFGAVEDAMAELALAGSDVVIPLEGAGEYLQALADSLTAVNAASALLGTAMLDTSVTSGVLADEIVQVFGGLDGYISATSFYFDTFYSAQEQVTALTAQLQGDLAALGIMNVPATEAEFRALVDAANAAGDPVLAAQLMAMSGQFVNLEDVTSAAAQAAEEAASALDAIAQERYGLETQLMTLQGDTVALRERELALLDPTNQALQEQIWAMGDLQAVADEAASLQRELWTLQGDTASLRADELAGLDASNRALQEQIWMLEDQKAALDALDPEAFKTLFDFQKASALAANGNYAPPSAPPNVLTTATPVTTTTAATDPVVIALAEVKAAIVLMQTEQRDLNMQTSVNTGSLRTLHQKWDGAGLPDTRTA